jgi:hypothetical protein
MSKLIVFTLVLLLPAINSFGQADSLKGNINKTDTLKQMDIKYWFASKRNGQEKQPKSNSLILMPLIASNPTAGVIYGAGLSYAFKTTISDDGLSLFTGNISNSTKGFLNLALKSNVFSENEKWLLATDWKYVSATETTYGLGTKKSHGRCHKSKWFGCVERHDGAGFKI